MKKIVLAVIIILGWFIGFHLYTDSLDWNKDTPCCMFKTDAVVVLTGGRDRVGTALLRLQDGLSDRVFISGVSKQIGLKEILAHYGQIELTEEQTAKIEIGYNARNTEENALEVNTWIKDNQIESIILITSDYHMPRSIIELKSVNANLEIGEAPVYSEKVSRKWWKSPKSFIFLAGEYNKLIYAYLRAKTKKLVEDI